MARKGGEVVKEGFLTKSPPAEKHLAARKRRYFVLWSNGTFEYYSSAAKRPQDYLKTVDLTHCEDMVAPITMQDRENIIKLTVKQGDKVRDYFLEADNRPEMDEWVGLLARVCGFSPVDEIDDYSLKLDLPSSEHPTTTLPPRKYLQTRPPIRSPSPTPLPSTGVQSGRVPMPPPKPQRPTEMDLSNYGMDSGNEAQEAMYFMLSPSGQSIPQDVPQGMYEEMEYDEQEMNQNPPPVWKPQPPQCHDSSPSIIYSRVEAGKIINQPRRRNEVPRYHMQSSTGNREARRKSPHHLPKHEAPPPQPKAVIPTYRRSEQNPMKGIMNDPALMEKLHEKRQELYGAVNQVNESVTSPDPQENYEEVSFDLAGTCSASNSDEESPPVFSRVTNMTLPPRRHNIGSEIAMMQCPAELKAQEYLSFQPSPSHSPQGSVCDLSKRDSYTRAQAEDVPELPPRGAERMRKGSPRLARKPVTPTAHEHTTPTVTSVLPHAQLKRPFMRERSLSQENFNQNPSPPPHGLPPRPTSSSLESPPPVPFRNTSAKDPKPPVRGPMPLPSEATAPEPPPRRRQVPVMRHSSSELSPPPPPVPTRRPDASGASLSASELGRLAPSIHTEDDAPPVPSRGARERGIPSLQRPHSTPETGTKPSPTTRPSIRPAHVGEVGVHAPQSAWNHKAPLNQDHKSSNLRPSPQPPVSAKPRVATKPAVSAKPVGSTKPAVGAKPVVSAKPQVNTKPKMNFKPMDDITKNTSGYRPPVAPRAVKTTLPQVASQKPLSTPNGEMPPPLPPR